MQYVSSNQSNSSLLFSRLTRRFSKGIAPFGPFSPKSKNDMQINPFTIAFSGKDRHLESEFTHHYFDVSLNQSRISIIFLAVIFSFYTALDSQLAPEVKYELLLIRFGIFIPYAMIQFFLTFHRSYSRFMQLSLCSIINAGGLCILLMTNITPSPINYMTYGEFLLVIFYGFTFMRIRFVWSTVNSLIFLMSYEVISLWTNKIPHIVLLNNSAFFIGAIVIGMLASYAIEYYTRKDFFLNRELEIERKKLSIYNQELEKRVNERTKKLEVINDSLTRTIHKQLATEKALRDSRTKYQNIVDNVTDFICVHDENGNIIEYNRQFQEKLEYTDEELRDLTIRELIPEAYRHEVDKYLHTIRDNSNMAGIMGVVSKSGKKYIVEYHNSFVKDPDGKIIIYSSARDITEKRKAQKALKESETRLKTIFDSVESGIVIADAETYEIVDANPSAVKLMGFSFETLKGRNIKEFICAKNSEVWETSESPVGIFRKEQILINSDREEIPILKTSIPIEISKRKLIIESFVSIKELKEAESEKRELLDQLKHSQKLQALGTLAGGIAHDFNNILYGMMGYTELAMDDSPEGSFQKDYLKEVLTGGTRAGDLIKQILTFSRQIGHEKKPIQLASLAKEALKLMRATLPTTIEFKNDIDDELKMISGDPTQIHQVIMNLFTNAGYAMRNKGGILHLTLANIERTHKDFPENSNHKPGPYVRMTVKDTGIGISEEYLPKIFDPFFTTKPQGEGIGMGLAVVHGIIMNHKAIINVQSKLNEGTVFTIDFPTALVEVTEMEKEEISPLKGKERILFIDDEKVLVRMQKKILESLGYEVTSLTSSENALNLFKKEPQFFDLVITDYTMPRMTGLDLAKELLKIRPDIPIILCTGFSEEGTEKKADEIGIRYIINKPIVREKVAAIIRRVFDR